jgi:uncharacterized repeat protein (TIGR01451 family)
VYVSLYKNSTDNIPALTTDSFDILIQPGDTATVSMSYIDASALTAPYVIAARVNDKYPVFTYWPECDSSNNVINFGLMTKVATLNGVQHNGRYSNPVSVLATEEITYEIKAVNAGNAGLVNIIDTLPAYMDYVTASADISYTGTPPSRTILSWWESVSAGGPMNVSFRAKIVAGASASQPLFPNQAWVRTPDNRLTPTNYTYHQGAGIAVVTFSALFGGSIYNADQQALDYRTSPRSGIIVVPDEGYRFAGWRHDEYVSLKGEVIRADSGIMYYDALTIYGNVELRAVFELDDSRDDNEGNREIEEITKPQQTGDRIWASKNMLYVRTNKAGSIVRIYRPDGALYEQHGIITEGTTEIRLEQGIYVVTLNNGIGQKVVIR